MDASQWLYFGAQHEFAWGPFEPPVGGKRFGGSVLIHLGNFHATFGLDPVSYPWTATPAGPKSSHKLLAPEVGHLCMGNQKKYPWCTATCGDTRPGAFLGAEKGWQVALSGFHPGLEKGQGGEKGP